MKYIFIIILAVFITGCDHKHHEHHDDHHDEKIKSHYTVYNDKYELYAEADIFVIGHSAHVLSHFTNLPDFTPVENSTITVKLVINDQVAGQTIEDPSIPGLYIFEIKPTIQGEGHLEFVINNKKEENIIIVPEVRVFSSHEDAVVEAETHEIHQVNTISFSKEQSWKTEFSTDYPTREPIGHIIKTSAQVRPSPYSETVISAGMSGIISNVGNNVLEGCNITKGQELFAILGENIAENNSYVRYMEAKYNYEKAKADYDRSVLLAGDKIISNKELLQIKNTYENTRSIYENLNFNFSAGGQKVISPGSGFIRQLFVKNGQYVETGQPLAVVSQDNTLILHAELQQKYSQHIHEVISANIKIPESGKVFSLDEMGGKIVSYGKATTAENYLIPVNIQIINTEKLFPGSIVELYLKTVADHEALTVPVSALTEEQGVFFIYVQLTPELFEKREISVGASDGIRTEVISGLAENERIVTKGAIMIKLSQSSGTLDAHSGHIH